VLNGGQIVEIGAAKISRTSMEVMYTGGPRKVKPTTILLVTFECIGKIQ